MTSLVWIVLFLVLIGLTITVGLNLDDEVLPSEEIEPEDDETDEIDEEETTEEANDDEVVSDDLQQEIDETERSVEETESSDPGSNQDQHDVSEDPADQYRPERDLVERTDGQYDLLPYEEPVTNTDKQNEYDDLGDPDDASEDLINAVEWLIDANTEAIHQRMERESYLDCLRNYIQEPRARGAEVVSETRWRDLSPNLSRLIGERYLVLALGLSCRGNRKMAQHRQAFLGLMGNTWANDELEQPLLYQCIGRMGLLTDTDLSSIGEELRSRIPGRTIHDDDPSIKQLTHYNALLFAVSSGEIYPFPKSEKGLSRLWHWDEHNPPLAELSFLPQIFYTLWIYYLREGESSEAANDFGALLGNWWDEEEPSQEFFEENPGVWESILLTAWATLSDQPLIWDQIQQRYEQLDFDREELIEVSERFFSWSTTYQETGTEPDNAPNGNILPPQKWIHPLPSQLLNDYSEPSFEYLESWCEKLTEPTPPKLEELN